MGRRNELGGDMKVKLGAHFFALLSLSGSLGCAPQGTPPVSLHSTYIPQALDGECQPTATMGSLELTDEVVELRGVVTGPGLDAPVESTGSLSGFTIDAIPEGTDRVLTVFGINAQGAETWRGYKSGITVEAGQDTGVDVLMTAKADLSCARSGQDQARAYHTATQLLDGRILLVGGANVDGANGDCATCSTLSATSFAELYDPALGTFRRTVGTTGTSALNVGRFFHTATLLPDGRVAIVGGTSEAEFVAVDAQNPFPIKPTMPVDTIEVFDPATELFSVVGSDPQGPRVFHATIVTGDENLLITGGIPGVPASGAHNLQNAYNSTTLCEATSLTCTLGPSMNKPRAGHLAKRIVLDSEYADIDRVLVLGGAVDTGAINDIEGYQLEGLSIGDAAFQMLDVTNMTDSRNVFFASSGQYVDYRFLVTGGLVRATDGTFSMATASGSTNEALVYIYFADHNEDPIAPGAISTGVAANPMSLTATRFLGSAAVLPDKIVPSENNREKRYGRVLITGGFSDLNFTPDDSLEVFSEDGVVDTSSSAISQITVGGAPRTLRQSRAGLASIGVGDGTVLISGGETGLDSDRTPLQTAEIFGDPNDPPTEVQ